MTPPRQSRLPRTRFPRLRFARKRITRWVLTVILGYYAACTVALVYLQWLPPLTTSVQMQRRIEAFLEGYAYQKRYSFIPFHYISPHLVHAVIAAEDARFLRHHGIDWIELGKVFDAAQRRGVVARGASTITQQLVKNLFLTTHRSIVRKGVEFSLAPLAEILLSKERILELYVNVVEWGPGVYGAEAAAQFYYGESAQDLSREHAARLVACLPAPLERTPAEMDALSEDIQERMRTMGW